MESFILALQYRFMDFMPDDRKEKNVLLYFFVKWLATLSVPQQMREIWLPSCYQVASNELSNYLLSFSFFYADLACESEINILVLMNVETYYKYSSLILAITTLVLSMQSRQFILGILYKDNLYSFCRQTILLLFLSRQKKLFFPTKSSILFFTNISTYRCPYSPLTYQFKSKQR